MANTETNQDKLKALQLTLDKIEKNFGKGSVMKLGDNVVEDVAVIPSGSIGLDRALGVGGYPKGRVIEIFGPESSGKTTLAIHAIAEAQKQGGIAAIIDAEHAFDRSYAEKLGVDVNNLFISQPDNGEQALEIAEQLIRSAAIDIIVIDSVAALTPKAEIEGDMGDSVMGLQARLMSQALRKLTGTISKTNTCCIFINQLRDKIGVMFGNPETTTGGNALKFYSSVRLDIRRVGQIKDGEEIYGNHTRVKVVKNKVAPPFKKAEFDIMYGEGISRSGEIVDLGVEYNVIKKSGSWFSYGESKLGQGRETVKQLVMDNPELAEELTQKIVEAMENGVQPTTKIRKSCNKTAKITMKSYLCSALVLLAMVSCDSKKEAVKPSYKTPDMKLASDVMTPEVLWSFGRIGSVSVSPDQKTLVYDVTYFNKEEDRSYSDIYVMNLADGKSKQLTDTDYKEFGETWTSDGKIAFMSSKSGSVQLWEMNADGSGLTQLTNIEGGIGGFIFSPDKSKLLFLKDVKLEQDVHDLHPDLPKANARLIDGQVYRHWNDWVEAYTHPFVADYIPGQMVTTGKDIMEGEKWESPVRPWGGTEQITWTKDGKGVIYMARKKEGIAYMTSTNTDLYLYDLNSGKTRNLTEGMMGYDQNQVISPNGELMAWESMERDGYERTKFVYS